MNLRMFDLANDDNSQKDSMELYRDALEATETGREGSDGHFYIKREAARRPELYLLANLVEALYSIDERLAEIRDALEDR